VDGKREPEDDSEPSLGHTNIIDQERSWRCGYLGKDGVNYGFVPDGDAEHDGREPEGGI
jgi:hypothetical protein